MRLTSDTTGLFSILTLLPLVSLLHWVPYSRELAWKKLCKEVVNMIFVEKTFVDCLLVLPIEATPQILQRELSQTAAKPQNSQTFSFSKVSC